MTGQMFYRQDESVAGEHLHYRDCGLDNIFLMNGFEVETHDGEEYLTVSDIDGLHKAIGLHIILERKAPSGKELRFLRDEMEMSQVDLGKALSVSDQSVARWEKGQTDIPGPAVFAIKVLYLFSLVPKDQRDEMLRRFLDALQSLSAADETSDSAIFSYVGGRWQDAA
jgi:DNA-binding transcriptional regulator YiaG